jgi:uncharacterized protein (TIGR03000 family)
MYSVLLMMAMTGGAEAPDLGHHGCCGGCYGDCGGCYGGCGGCCGGGHGFCGGHHHHHGCCGGDYGCCGGCCGGGHGFCGHHHHHHGCCGGCYGCNGGCYGSSYGCGGGCYGYSYGGSWDGHGSYAPTWGGDGGYLAPGAVPGGPGAVPGGPGGPGGPVAPPADLPKDGKKTSLSAPASIVVSLPADATLTIDGQATRSKSETRRFISPALPAGKDFTYTLEAEITRDGETMTATEQVTVRAGEETTVSLPMSKFSTASVAGR